MMEKEINQQSELWLKFTILYFHQNVPSLSYRSNPAIDPLQTFHLSNDITHPAITCSKLTRETLEQDVKYVQS